MKISFAFLSSGNWSEILVRLFSCSFLLVLLSGASVGRGVCVVALSCECAVIASCAVAFKSISETCRSPKSARMPSTSPSNSPICSDMSAVACSAS
eukprot:2321540-Pyramimonas_sp.AAC.1